jgi:hypothetical protein
MKNAFFYNVECNPNGTWTARIFQRFAGDRLHNLSILTEGSQERAELEARQVVARYRYYAESASKAAAATRATQ